MRLEHDELVAALDYAVVAGIRVCAPQFAHRLSERLLEFVAITEVLQHNGEVDRGIRTSTRGLHERVVHRVCAVRRDVAPLRITDVSIVNEAQSARVERLLVLQHERQIRAGQSQMPDSAAHRHACQVAENRVVARGDCIAVDRRAGGWRGRAAIGHMGSLVRLLHHGRSPTVVVNLAQLAEGVGALRTQHLAQRDVLVRGRVSQ